MRSTFSGAELRLVRTFHGLALDDVAARIGKTRQYIYKIETEQAQPTEELTADLAVALGVAPQFFFARGYQAGEDQFHFRKLAATRVGIKQSVIARGTMIARLVNWLERDLIFPALHIPEVSRIADPRDIERVAEICRNEWGVGTGPIADTVRLAEHVGAVVTSFRATFKEVDALSVSASRPIIVRSEAKESTCRHRFDVAHELGHFVLHEGQITGDRLTEGDANRFASALLVPRGMMVRFFPRGTGSRLDWKGISEFKLAWKVSKAAILYRARQLDLITEAKYRSGVITLRRTGEATREREDNLIAQETPALLTRAFDVLATRKGIMKEDIATAINWSPELLEEVVGFPIPSRSGKAVNQNKERPRVWLVKA